MDRLDRVEAILEGVAENIEEMGEENKKIQAT